MELIYLFKVKELHMLIGLPGSGKTTFAKSVKNAEVIDFDYIYRECLEGLEIKVTSEKLEKLLPNSLTSNIVVLDGLFMDQFEVENILSLFIEWCNKKDINIEKIILEYWRPNKKKCLWNVKDRNDDGVNLSIELFELEKPSRKEIEKKFKIKTELNLYTVVKKGVEGK